MIFASSQFVRQPADADQRAEDGRQHDADDGDLQRVQHADEQRPAIGIRPPDCRGSATSPIGMPATRSRKPKPVAMWRAARFAMVLRIRYQAISDDDADDDDLPDDGAEDRVATRTAACAFFGAARAAIRRGSAAVWDIGLSAPLVWRVVLAITGPSVMCRSQCCCNMTVRRIAAAINGSTQSRVR